MKLYEMLLNNFKPLLNTDKTFKMIQGINTEGRLTDDIYIRAEDNFTIVTVHMGAGIYKEEVFNSIKKYLSQFLKEEFQDAPAEWIEILVTA